MPIRMDPFHLHGRFHTNPCVLRYAKTLLFLKDYEFIRQTVLYQNLLKQLINNLTDCDFTCLANVLPGRFGTIFLCSCSLFSFILPDKNNFMMVTAVATPIFKTYCPSDGPGLIFAMTNCVLWNKITLAMIFDRMNL
jgi:hypothetical protein